MKPAAACRSCLPAFCCTMLSLGMAGIAAAQDAPGQTLVEKTKAAYDRLDVYRATLDFRIEQRTGRWLNTQRATFHTGYDRANQRVLIDKPDLYLVVADDDLKIKSDQLPGTYLDAEAPDPLTMTTLIQTVPLLAQPMLVDLVFAMDDEPVALLTGGDTTRATPLTPDEEGRLRMEVATAEGRLEFFVDPSSHLIEQVIFHMKFQGRHSGDYARLVYEYRYDTAAAVPDDAFAFEDAGLQVFDTFEQWMSQTQVAGGAAGPGGAGGASAPAYALTDQDAPDIDSVVIETTEGEVKTFKLDELDQPIVVLHFWASWLPAAFDSIPKLEQLADWADREKLPIAIYSINSGDSISEIRTFLRNQKVTTLPVIRDRDYDLSDAYVAHTIPLTVIIVDGKVRTGITGYDDNMVQLLQQQLQPYLEAIEAQEQESDPSESESDAQGATP